MNKKKHAASREDEVLRKKQLERALKEEQKLKEAMDKLKKGDS